MTPKEIRVKSRHSQTAAAALVPCSPNSWRLYEANPSAVTPDLRARCDAALQKMRSLAESKAA